MLEIEKNIALYLQEQGMGTIGGTSKTGWNIFIGYMPTEPFNAICIYEWGGRPNQTLIGYSGCHFKFYVKIRANTYSMLMSKANDVYDLLKFNPLIVYTGGSFTNIIADTNIMNAGREKSSNGEKPLVSMVFSGLYNEV